MEFVESQLLINIFGQLLAFLMDSFNPWEKSTIFQDPYSSCHQSNWSASACLAFKTLSLTRSQFPSKIQIES